MTSAVEGGEWSAARPSRTLPPWKTRYSFYKRLGGTQGRSGRAENLVLIYIYIYIYIRKFSPYSEKAQSMSIVKTPINQMDMWGNNCLLLWSVWSTHSYCWKVQSFVMIRNFVCVIITALWNAYSTLRTESRTYIDCETCPRFFLYNNFPFPFSTYLLDSLLSDQGNYGRCLGVG